MKKLQNLGKALSKQEQKRIIGSDYGGGGGSCPIGESCEGTCSLTCNGSTITGTCVIDAAKTGNCRCVGVC